MCLIPVQNRATRARIALEACSVLLNRQHRRVVLVDSDGLVHIARTTGSVPRAAKYHPQMELEARMFHTLLPTF